MIDTNQVTCGFWNATKAHVLIESEVSNQQQCTCWSAVSDTRCLALWPWLCPQI